MRSGEPLERDPSGDDGEGSETTTSGDADADADADPSMFMTVSGVESIAMNETKKDVMLLMPKRKCAQFGGRWVRRTSSTSTAHFSQNTSPNWA